MQSMRSTTRKALVACSTLQPEKTLRKRLTALVLVAGALLAVAALGAPAAAAEATVSSVMPVSDPSSADLPLLTKLRVDGRMITVQIACRTDSRVNILVGGERLLLGSVGLECRKGSARGIVTVTTDQMRRLGAQKSNVLVELAGKDHRLLASLPLDRPHRSRQRTLQAHLTWIGPASICSRSYGASQAMIELIPNGSRFGYAFGTRLWWRGMLLEHNARTGVQTWLYGPWVPHDAGWTSTQLRQTFTVNAGSYYRPAIQIYGGDWNYVPVNVILGTGLVPYSGWCYVP